MIPWKRKAVTMTFIKGHMCTYCSAGSYFLLWAWVQFFWFSRVYDHQKLLREREKQNYPSPFSQTTYKPQVFVAGLQPENWCYNSCRDFEYTRFGVSLFECARSIMFIVSCEQLRMISNYLSGHNNNILKDIVIVWSILHHLDIIPLACVVWITLGILLSLVWCTIVLLRDDNDILCILSYD